MSSTTKERPPRRHGTTQSRSRPTTATTPKSAADPKHRAAIGTVRGPSPPTGPGTTQRPRAPTIPPPTGTPPLRHPTSKPPTGSPTPRPPTSKPPPGSPPLRHPTSKPPPGSPRPRPPTRKHPPGIPTPRPPTSKPPIGGIPSRPPAKLLLRRSPILSNPPSCISSSLQCRRGFMRLASPLPFTPPPSSFTATRTQLNQLNRLRPLLSMKSLLCPTDPSPCLLHPQPPFILYRRFPQCSIPSSQAPVRPPFMLRLQALSQAPTSNLRPPAKPRLPHPPLPRQISKPYMPQSPANNQCRICYRLRPPNRLQALAPNQLSISLQSQPKPRLQHHNQPQSRLYQ